MVDIKVANLLKKKQRERNKERKKSFVSPPSSTIEFYTSVSFCTLCYEADIFILCTSGTGKFDDEDATINLVAPSSRVFAFNDDIV